MWSQPYLQPHLQALTWLLMNQIIYWGFSPDFTYSVLQAVITGLLPHTPPEQSMCFVGIPDKQGKRAGDPSLPFPQCCSGWLSTHRSWCINDSQMDLFPSSPIPEFSPSLPNLLGNREEQTSGALREGWTLHRLCTLPQPLSTFLMDGIININHF